MQLRENVLAMARALGHVGQEEDLEGECKALYGKPSIWCNGRRQWEWEWEWAQLALNTTLVDFRLQRDPMFRGRPSGQPAGAVGSCARQRPAPN
jgi:hypothetical protein